MCRLAAALLGALCLTTPAAQADTTPTRAGIIKTLTGEASIERGGKTQPARLGDAVFPDDVLRTAVGGKLGVTLEDDTRVSLGSDSALRVARLRYAPAQGRLEMVLQFLRGTAAYVSGRIAKLAPDAVRLETPNAIVGVRGTTAFIEVGPQ
jgi:hypothetical protein